MVSADCHATGLARHSCLGSCLFDDWTCGVPHSFMRLLSIFWPACSPKVWHSVSSPHLRRRQSLGVANSGSYPKKPQFSNWPVWDCSNDLLHHTLVSLDTLTCPSHAPKSIRPSTPYCHPHFSNSLFFPQHFLPLATLKCGCITLSNYRIMSVASSSLLMLVAGHQSCNSKGKKIRHVGDLVSASNLFVQHY